MIVHWNYDIDPVFDSPSYPLGWGKMGQQGLMGHLYIYIYIYIYINICVYILNFSLSSEILKPNEVITVSNVFKSNKKRKKLYAVFSTSITKDSQHL